MSNLINYLEKGIALNQKRSCLYNINNNSNKTINREKEWQTLTKLLTLIIGDVEIKDHNTALQERYVAIHWLPTKFENIVNKSETLVTDSGDQINNKQ
jgi:hypothetical protein